jgi:hypothetical protein
MSEEKHKPPLSITGLWAEIITGLWAEILQLCYELVHRDNTKRNCTSMEAQGKEGMR